MTDECIISRIEETIGCHFKCLDKIDYRNNNAHYAVDPYTSNVIGLRLPMRARVIPLEVFTLVHLTELDISLVKIDEMPQDLIKLECLKRLNLYDSEIKYLPFEIGKLSELVNINLARTPLMELPDSICNLKKLEKLYLWATKIRALPQNIGNLQRLRTLDLSECRLKTFPESIVNLQIDFRDDSEFDCIKTTGLSVDDKNVYEHSKRGKEALSQYFKNRALHPEKTEFESRLVLLGNGGAGKTCVMHALLNNFFDPVQTKTEGITVSDWIVNDAGKKGCIHIWDFGGQEAYRPLYSLFLAKSDLYLIVLNGRSDEKPDDWLEFMRFFAHGAPVIIVINRTDENPRARIDSGYIRNKFKDINIAEIINCSCKDYEKPEGNIGVLRRTIMNTINKYNLKLICQANWEVVRQRLYSLGNEYSYSDFIVCCEDCGVILKEEQEKILKAFCSYGIIIKPDGSRHLFANPNWFSNIVSSIYGYAETQNDKYIFSREDLVRYFLSANPTIRDDTVDNILESLVRSIICITPENDIIVPSVLPLYADDYEADHESLDKYVIIYNMSTSLFFHRLLAHLYEDRKGNDYIWCNAIQVQFDECTIFIEQLGNEIIIYAPKAFPNNNYIQYFEYLLFSIQEVHKELGMSNIYFEIFIPKEQRRNQEMTQVINNFGGQVVAPNDTATVNAPYIQTSTFDQEKLSILLAAINKQIPYLPEADRALAENALNEIKEAIEQKRPEKNRLEKALGVLNGIKGTVEFGSAVAGVATFIMALFKENVV